MGYEVRFSLRAWRDFGRLYEHIRAEESEAALTWYRGFRRAILSLEEKPNRCPVTPESGKLRHLLYGRGRNVYRAIFRVDEEEKLVVVVHIRHGARRPFGGIR